MLSSHLLRIAIDTTQSHETPYEPCRFQTAEETYPCSGLWVDATDIGLEWHGFAITFLIHSINAAWMPSCAVLEHMGGLWSCLRGRIAGLRSRGIDRVTSICSVKALLSLEHSSKQSTILLRKRHLYLQRTEISAALCR